jgi:hypothetical protein
MRERRKLSSLMNVKCIFYLGKEKRERAEKLSSLVECMKREGQNDIFVSRKSDGAAGGQNSVK